jgi:hypothetical protein
MMTIINITRRAYNKLKKHGEVLLQDISVPSTLRAKHGIELSFPSKHGKRTMTIAARVVARVKMGHHESGVCHLTVAK